jgi:hypothetical protein
MIGRIALAPLALGALISLGGCRQEVSSPAPSIVTATPAPGSTVAPGSTTFRVTFSQDMREGSYSLVRHGSAPFPPVTTIDVENGDTVVFTADLEPARTYSFWFNSPRYTGFRSLAGVPLEPYLYTVTTTP